MPEIDPYSEFHSKVFYDKFAFFNESGAIDMWYDRSFYGRVDEFQNSVYISNSDLEYKIKKLDIEEPKGLYTLNFVSDAFTKLRNYIQKANTAGKIPNKGLYSSLKPKQAYTNMETSYNSHIEEYYNIFKVYLNGTGKTTKIDNIEEFIDALMEFAKNFPGELPLTRTTFIKSKFFNPLSTGLMIDLHTVDANDDEKRIACLADETFSFFSTAAKKHGFYIVKHMPWRIVANISSVSMQKYFMSPEPQFYDEQGMPLGVNSYGLNLAPGTATNLFGQRGKIAEKQIRKREKLNMGDYDDWKSGAITDWTEEYVLVQPPPYYNKSYLGDITELKMNIVKMWNMFVMEEPYRVQEMRCGKTNMYKKEFTKRQSVGVPPTPEDAPFFAYSFKLPKFHQDLVLNYFNSNPKTNERFWIMTYKNVLLYENNVKISGKRNKRLDKTIQNHYDVYGYTNTLNFINNYFKKVKGLKANAKDCQSYTLCTAEQQKILAKKIIPSNVKIIQDTTTPTPTAATGYSGGGGSTGGSSGGMGGGY